VGGQPKTPIVTSIVYALRAHKKEIQLSFRGDRCRRNRFGAFSLKLANSLRDVARGQRIVWCRTGSEDANPSQSRFEAVSQ
jgi:hypothetical protein